MEQIPRIVKRGVSIVGAALPVPEKFKLYFARGTSRKQWWSVRRRRIRRRGGNLAELHPEVQNLAVEGIIWIMKKQVEQMKI